MRHSHILVTGCAGFIGSHLSEKLLLAGLTVTGVDNFDSFYSKEAKLKNIQNCLSNDRFKFIEGDVSDANFLENKLSSEYGSIIHLAGKAGVLPSIKNPIDYCYNNIIGLVKLLEFAKSNSIKKFVFASSSSVYGINSSVPWVENDETLVPISPYAVTKLSGELLGKLYSSLHDIQFLALRFFTVYGPRQRPDLAIHKFTKMIMEGSPITLYGNGNTKRDYTYIDDTVQGIVSALNYEDTKFEIINIGNNTPVTLLELVESIEKAVGKKAGRKYLPEQDGDVPVTYANIDKARKLLNYQPTIKLDTGMNLFYKWMKSND